MLKDLKLYNYPSAHKLRDELQNDQFVLKTCQRTLILSHGELDIVDSEIKPEQVSGREAYQFLLETICGLKSKLLGENEIVSQFKNSFKLYLTSNNKNNKLIKIIEKLLKDSKEVRTKHLIGISQKTYASITKKIICSQSNASRVLIIGSGSLAEDLINQFKKKIDVTICARNEQKVLELAKINDLQILPWENLSDASNFNYIANTIGIENILFDNNFFYTWGQNNKKTFIDLGSPSSIDTPMGKDDGVYRLNDIFHAGAIHENKKKDKIFLAKNEIHKLVIKREYYLNKAANHTIGVEVA